MTMAAHTITAGFDTNSFSGENGHNQWFDNTILCFHSKDKVFLDKRHPKSKSHKKKASMLLDKEADDGVMGSLSSSSVPIDIPSPLVVDNNYRLI